MNSLKQPPRRRSTVRRTDQARGWSPSQSEWVLEWRNHEDSSSVPNCSCSERLRVRLRYRRALRSWMRLEAGTAVREAVTVDKSLNLKDAERRYVESETRQPPKARSVFRPPSTVLNQTFQLPGHGLLFCVHGRSYFEPCSATTCRRTKKEADRRLAKFLENI